MGIDDAVNKGKDLYEQNKDKIAEAVKSEQAEDISDKVLDGVADFAKKIAPGAADKIDEIRDSADKAVGNESQPLTSLSGDPSIGWVAAFSCADETRRFADWHPEVSICQDKGSTTPWTFGYRRSRWLVVQPEATGFAAPSPQRAGAAVLPRA
jgi:hypothetical protein